MSALNLDEYKINFNGSDNYYLLYISKYPYIKKDMDVMNICLELNKKFGITKVSIDKNYDLLETLVVELDSPSKVVDVVSEFIKNTNLSSNKLYRENGEVFVSKNKVESKLEKFKAKFSLN